MKIQLKRSNVLDGGVAKQPTSEQMAFGELAVNYSSADPAIFLKDSAGDIVQIAGPSSVTTIPTLDEVTTKGNFSSDGILIGGSLETSNISLNNDGSASF